MKNRIALFNVFSSILLQFFTIISGFIIPKLIITYFGSEVNGLVSSIVQLLSYISLIEGGITAVIISKLFKPLADNNYSKVSSIIVTADKFYKGIGYIFIVYALLVSLICPFIYGDNFSYFYVFSLSIILSLTLFIQFMLTLSLKCLLNADKKVYLISFTQILILLLNLIFSYLSVKIYPSIHVFKFISGIVYIFQPIIFSLYIKRNYNLNYSLSPDNNLIKDRWDGFANNIAYFILTSTDITILSFFSSLSFVSVYSVYSLVTNGIKALFGSINNGLYPSIGRLVAENEISILNDKFDIYEFLYLSMIFFVSIITALLINPFILVYIGNNSSSVIYNQELFGYLLVFATLLDLSKTPYVNIAYSANKFKELKVPSIIEALINIIISLILVFKFGLIGVAVGTIAAMFFRLIYQIRMTEKLIYRNRFNFFRNYLIYLFFSFILFFLLNNYLPITNISFISLIKYGLIYFLIVFLSFIFIIFICFRKEVKQTLDFFKRYKSH